MSTDWETCGKVSISLFVLSCLTHHRGFYSYEEIYKYSNNHLRFYCFRRGSGFYAKAKVFGFDFCCIITDHHVIGCEEEARGATVIFHYDKKNQGAQVQLKPDKLFRTNPVSQYLSILPFSRPQRLAMLSSSFSFHSNWIIQSLV